jgi:hypothetical protein
VIQFGWASRSLSNILVDGVDVIHMRYSSNGSHPSILGANQIYLQSETNFATADLTNTVQDVTFRNIRAEGIGGNLMRIFPLSNYNNVTIENVSLEAWSVRTTGIYESQFPLVTNAGGTAVSVRGFVIKNFTVAGTTISQAAGNYGPNSQGGLNIASYFLGSGGVTIVA